MKRQSKIVDMYHKMPFLGYRISYDCNYDFLNILNSTHHENVSGNMPHCVWGLG